MFSGPRACYDEGKRVAETLSYAYAKQEKVDVRVARIFNTFGPRMHMDDGRVVSNFILQALKNEPITVKKYFIFLPIYNQYTMEVGEWSIEY
jgi:UDP-glucuronate decarboxylase